MDDQKVKELIEKDPDYVDIKRFQYSLKNLLQRYPEGAPDRVIAQALDIPEEKVQELYEDIIEKLRDLMV